MPYKFKDNQNKTYSKNLKLLFTGLAGFIISQELIAAYYTQRIDIHAIVNIGLACFVLWGIWFNGYYKIMRKYSEWKLKKQDSKFDYFHT